MSEKRGIGQLGKALFGRPGAAHQPPAPPVDIPPLADMLRDLLALPDRVFGHYAFSRDILRRKLSVEDIDTLLPQANACGADYAGKARAQYGSDNPSLLAERMGLTVEYPDLPPDPTRVTFALFTPPATISIVQDGLDKFDALLQDEEIAGLLGHFNPAQTLLAHELFHRVEEENRDEIFTRTYKIDLWKLPIPNRSTLRALSEVAGMAFARELVGLPFSPFVLDMFFVYAYAKAPAYGLYKEMMELARELGEM